MKFAPLIILAIVALTLVGCSEEPAAPTTAAGTLHAIEGDMPESRYRAALARLAPKCREPGTRIADFAVNVQAIIDDETGEKEPLISILEQVGRSIPRELGKTKCGDMFTVYAQLRTGG